LAITLTDVEIDSLIHEEKLIVSDFFSSFHLTRKGGHQEGKKDFTGLLGSQFRVFVRQGVFNPFDFSIGLLYLLPNSNKAFILRRYNGKSHEHTNKIELDKFYGFHIHTATARYQELGQECEDGYAVATDAYADLNGAMRCMESECGFVVHSVNRTVASFRDDHDE
jgi:hypothetical protein